MKKLFTMIGISLLMLSCQYTGEQEMKQKKQAAASAFYEQESYAVIWEWTTTDEQIIIDHVTEITKDLMHLWDQQVIENVYFKAEAEIKNGMDFPSISFFIKASNVEEAKKHLNELTIVKQGIAK